MGRWENKRLATTRHPVVWAGAMALTACSLAGCGGFTQAAVPTPIKIAAARPNRTETPHVTWYPVSVGSPRLLAEGAQVSSVLSGPKGRIYYGTVNPWADAAAIGWLNPAAHVNHWTSVPSANPPFPAQSGLNALDAQQAAAWGGVSLIEAGSRTIWYRHWGYVGGWLAATARFVSGGYNIPGPTVDNAEWSVSVSSTFSGMSQIAIENNPSGRVRNIPLPNSVNNPVAIALTGGTTTVPPLVTLMTNNTLFTLSPDGHWSSAWNLSISGDFFVAMGQWGSELWTLDANGNIDQWAGGRLHSVGHVRLAPLGAVSAPGQGLWIATPHDLVLWQPRSALKSWPWPQSVYPAPASSWPTTGASEPPDWPPASHISAGPHQSAIIGNGIWIGVATLTASTHAQGGQM